ncbi:MAG: isoaspartyl peptidase/L-asparaginase [Vitreoscilla sp.]
MNAQIVTHGGTGSKVSQRDGCIAAVKAGLERLTGGDDALAAVIAAVSVLEADGRFNAGRGALLGMDGRTMSCDASVMDSRGKLGAVANLLEVPHPVQVARRVADTPHHLLVGAGALEFAKKLGLHSPFPPTESALAEYREQVDELRKSPQQTSGDAEDSEGDDGKAAIRQFWNFPGSWQAAADAAAHATVGAVARDGQGGFAAAVSTGGSMPALLGRVADSPLIGCGFYAGEAGAIACTGIGEHILRHMLAGRIYAGLERGIPLRTAIEEGMARLPPQVEVGVIAITADDAQVVSRKPMASANSAELG